MPGTGTQFTCVTSTKVQTPTPELERRNPLVEAAQRLQHLCAQALSVPELRDAGVSVFLVFEAFSCQYLSCMRP